MIDDTQAQRSHQAMALISFVTRTWERWNRYNLLSVNTTEPVELHLHRAVMMVYHETFIELTGRPPASFGHADGVREFCSRPGVELPFQPPF